MGFDTVVAKLCLSTPLNPFTHSLSLSLSLSPSLTLSLSQARNQSECVPNASNPVTSIVVPVPNANTPSLPQ